MPVYSLHYSNLQGTRYGVTNVDAVFQRVKTVEDTPGFEEYFDINGQKWTTMKQRHDVMRAEGDGGLTDHPGGCKVSRGCKYIYFSLEVRADGDG